MYIVYVYWTMQVSLIAW